MLDCERLLRVLLRRSWRRLSGRQRTALHDAARRFELDRATIATPPIEPATAAWCLLAMHWRGCRHPAALFCAPAHPPTAIVRWLSALTVVEQVERPREILLALARAVARTGTMAGAVTRAMAAHGSLIALLPELLA